MRQTADTETCLNDKRFSEHSVSKEPKVFVPMASYLLFASLSTVDVATSCSNEEMISTNREISAWPFTTESVKSLLKLHGRGMSGVGFGYL